MRRLSRRVLARLMRPDPRECAEVRSLMSEYVEEELEPDRRRRVEEHVEFCPRCRTVLANLRQTLVRLSSLGGFAPPGAVDSDRVAERVSRAWRGRA